MATNAKEPRVLLVKRQHGPDFKITVPATAKVTMSAALNPQGRSYDGGCLRVYEGTKQTACFIQIAEFRDLTYEVEELVEEIEIDETLDSRGNRKGQRKVNRRFEEVY